MNFQYIEDIFLPALEIFAIEQFNLGGIKQLLVMTAEAGKSIKGRSASAEAIRVGSPAVREDGRSLII